MNVEHQMSLFDHNNGAVFSSDMLYRYSLWRIWNTKKEYVAWVCLNPSTADEEKNDPTIIRCINFAERWGYGGIMIVNLFAYRSTNPKNLFKIYDPIGPNNNHHIRKVCSGSGIIIVAWGNHNIIGDRHFDVLKIINNPHCLSLTNNGHPRHPLYLKKDLKPMKYSWRSEVGGRKNEKAN